MHSCGQGVQSKVLFPGAKGWEIGETDFYTPPVLGGAALLDNSVPAVYKIQDP